MLSGERAKVVFKVISKVPPWISRECPLRVQVSEIIG